MVLAQSTHRLPQLLLRDPAKNFCGLALPAARMLEAQASAKGAVFGAPDAEVQRDDQIGQTEGESSWTTGSRWSRTGGR